MSSFYGDKSSQFNFTKYTSLFGEGPRDRLADAKIRHSATHHQNRGRGFFARQKILRNQRRIT